MAITDQQLQNCIHHARFPLEVRIRVNDIITQGLTSYREHRKRWYYSSSTGRKIKKPSLRHHAPEGRHDQTGSRNVLISALCQAWMFGFGIEPTLNHKNDRDTDFAKFAMEIMQLEGIGHAHQHLETYWSFRKREWQSNQFHIEKWRVSGGS
jgi:hypothetical protein